MDFSIFILTKSDTSKLKLNKRGRQLVYHHNSARLPSLYEAVGGPHFTSRALLPRARLTTNNARQDGTLLLFWALARAPDIHSKFINSSHHLTIAYNTL